MADWSELKRLAEEAQSTFGSFDPSEAEFDLMAAITPDVILALIAENKQLREDHDKQWRLAQSGIQNTEAVLAENAKLRAEVEALRKDAERFAWLCTHAVGHPIVGLYGDELAAEIDMEIAKEAR